MGGAVVARNVYAQLAQALDLPVLCTPNYDLLSKRYGCVSH
jgi:hypothetical protein